MTVVMVASSSVITCYIFVFNLLLSVLLPKHILTDDKEAEALD